MPTAEPPIKKRKKPATLKSFSAKLMRVRGWIVGDVERHAAGFSFDLFGIADLLAFRPPETGSVLIQVTACSHAADHRTKMLASPNTKPWLLCGNRIFLHLWEKRGPRGGLKTWKVFESSFELDSDGNIFEIKVDSTIASGS